MTPDKHRDASLSTLIDIGTRQLQILERAVELLEVIADRRPGAPNADYHPEITDPDEVLSVVALHLQHCRESGARFRVADINRQLGWKSHNRIHGPRYAAARRMIAQFRSERRP